jgi:hypothetical protein
VSKQPRPRAALFAISLIAATLAACGSVSRPGIGADNVAEIGNTPITKATLSHWMSALAGSDFYEHTGKRAPKGLVSDPPNYAICVSAVQALSPSIARGQLDLKCRQLYTAIKAQALSYLITAQWQIEEGAERHIFVTEGQELQMLKRLKAEQFPRPGEFATYLANRDWTLSDERHEVKQNLTASKLLAKLEQQDPTGGRQAAFKLLATSATKRSGRTRCRSGYLVPGCREYKKTRESSAPSASVIIEQIVAGQ